jgi:hypothetical protein
LVQFLVAANDKNAEGNLFYALTYWKISRFSSKIDFYLNEAINFGSFEAYLRFYHLNS